MAKTAESVITVVSIPDSARLLASCWPFKTMIIYNVRAKTRIWDYSGSITSIILGVLQDEVKYTSFLQRSVIMVLMTETHEGCICNAKHTIIIILDGKIIIWIFLSADKNN